MSSFTYGVSKEIYSYNGDERVSYGLVVYADAEISGTLIIAASANDLTLDENELQEFANKCNEEKLSPIHFDDVVDDFLARNIDNTK